MANVVKRDKGAVQPAEDAPSGNEYKRWKGAVQPARVEGAVSTAFSRGWVIG